MRKLEGINWRDCMSALVLLALSLLICFGSLYTLSYGHYYLPGSGFLPFWSGLLLGLMSLGLLAKSILQRKGKEEIFFLGNLNKPLYTLLTLIAYGLLFGILGHFLCNFLFMLFMLLMLERKKWFVAFGGGLVTALTFYLVFSVWLKLPLPRGIFVVF